MSEQELHIHTPLVESVPLSGAAGADVWLKIEAMQPSGSFKLRGIGRACRRHARRGASGFVASSGGNAGIAVAYAGRKLGLPVTVVVPESTTKGAVDKIWQEGAAPVIHGKTWQEAHMYALSLTEGGRAMIHPFDDPLLWDGHATMIDEVAESGLCPDLVVLSVGGGGLLCGVVEGLRRNDMPDVPVVAVETVGADSLAASLRAGSHVGLEDITSIATSLGAKKVARRAYDWCAEHPVTSHLVSDRDAVAACLRFCADHRLLVEPACGAALAPLYAGAGCLSGAGTILVIVCGGAGVSIVQLRRWEKDFQIDDV